MFVVLRIRGVVGQGYSPRVVDFAFPTGLRSIWLSKLEFVVSTDLH